MAKQKTLILVYFFLVLSLIFGLSFNVHGGKITGAFVLKTVGKLVGGVDFFYFSVILIVFFSVFVLWLFARHFRFTKRTLRENVKPISLFVVFLLVVFVGFGVYFGDGKNGITGYAAVEYDSSSGEITKINGEAVVYVASTFTVPEPGADFSKGHIYYTGKDYYLLDPSNTEFDVKFDNGYYTWDVEGENYRVITDFEGFPDGPLEHFDDDSQTWVESIYDPDFGTLTTPIQGSNGFLGLIFNEVADGLAYEATWQLLNLVLGDFAFGAVTDYCKEEWESSDPNHNPINANTFDVNPLRAAGLTNASANCQDELTTVTAQGLRNVTGTGFTYQTSWTILACNETVQYEVFMKNSQKLSIVRGIVNKGNATSENRLFVRTEAYDDICVEVSDVSIGINGTACFEMVSGELENVGKNLQDYVIFENIEYFSFADLDTYNGQPIFKFDVSNLNKESVVLNFISGIEGISKETLVKRVIAPGDSISVFLPADFLANINLDQPVTSNAYYRAYLNDDKKNPILSDIVPFDVYPFAIRDIQLETEFFSSLILDQYVSGETPLVIFNLRSNEVDPLKVTFVSEIEGVSQRVEESLVLGPNGNLQKSLSPFIDKDKVTGITEANFIYGVYLEGNQNNILDRYMYNIELYPTEEDFIGDAIGAERLSYDLLEISDILMEEELLNSEAYKLSIKIKNGHDSARKLLITPQTSSYDISIIPFFKEVRMEAGEEATVTFDVGLTSYLVLNEAVISVLIEDENFYRIKELRKEIKVISSEKFVTDDSGETFRYKAQRCVEFSENEQIIPSDIWLFLKRGHYSLTYEEDWEISSLFEPFALGFQTRYSSPVELQDKIIQIFRDEGLPYSDEEIENFVRFVFNEGNVVIQELETRKLSTLLPTLFHERIHFWQFLGSPEERNKLVNFYDHFSLDYEYGNIRDYMNLIGYNYFEDEVTDEIKIQYLDEFFAFIGEAEEYPDQTYSDEDFRSFYGISPHEKISTFLIFDNEVLNIYNRWKDSSKIALKSECDLPLEKLPELVIS